MGGRDPGSGRGEELGEGRVSVSACLPRPWAHTAALGGLQTELTAPFPGGHDMPTAGQSGPTAGVWTGCQGSFMLLGLAPSSWGQARHKEMSPGFPGGPVVKNLPASAEGMGSIPGLGGSRLTKPVHHNY